MPGSSSTLLSADALILASLKATCKFLVFSIRIRPVSSEFVLVYKYHTVIYGYPYEAETGVGGNFCSLSECKIFINVYHTVHLLFTYYAHLICTSVPTINTTPCVPRATLSTAEYPAKNHGEALQRYNEANRGPNDVVQDVTFYR